MSTTGETSNLPGAGGAPGTPDASGSPGTQETPNAKSAGWASAASPVPPSGSVHSAPGAPAPETAPHYTPTPGSKKYKRVGDYDVVSKLGQGAMGSVYLATQVSTGRQVALKILPPDLAKDQELLERFKREARASQRFSHANVVSALEFGTFEKYHFLAMEYVDGPDLETMLKRNGPFDHELLLKMAYDVCAALEEIERHGIVHRDIKPSNIMMTSLGVFRLADLGLASAGQGDQRLTVAGFAVGTPYYLSPEQARGQLDVDIRADIYAFGATMYHLATGSVPFPGTNPVVVMTQHLSAPLKPPHEVMPSVSLQMSALIAKMMEKDAGDRPQNAAQLRELITQCKRGQLATGTTKSASAGASTTGAQAASADGGGALDAALGFLPKGLRVPAVVGLVLACLALVGVIVWFAVMKR